MDGMRRSFTLVAAVGASTLAILYYYNKQRQQKQQNADNFSFSHLLDRTEDVGDVTTEVTTHDTTSSSSEDVTVTTNDTEINQSTGFEDTVVDESKRCRKILLLGLEKCGKSCLLAKLSHNMMEENTYAPTKGYNVVCVAHQNHNISMWEIGGSESYRSYWRNFCATTDLVLFVVDANQSGKFHQAKEFIFEVVTELEDGVDFHIVANTTTYTPSHVMDGLEDVLGVKRLNIPVHSVNLEYDSDDDGADVRTLLSCCLDKFTS